MGFYKNRDKEANVLSDCKEHSGIKNSVGLFINEGIHVHSSPFLREDGAECMQEAMKCCQVLCDLDGRAYYVQHPTI